jgi:outer membrane scaffolding protein for murein synthesis (MipA/OmpV family)
MKKIDSFLIAVLTLTSTLIFTFSDSAYAQSTTQNLMPDGSHDMYLGLGVLSRPFYEGSKDTKRVVIPVMQMEWSNGFFLAGMGAGWHLSNQLKHEFGPLVSLELNRTSNGISNMHTQIGVPGTSNCNTCSDSLGNGPHASLNNKLASAEKIQTRLLYGGFYNYQLTNNLRQINTLQFGAGNDQQGIRLSSDLRYQIKDILPHHHFTLGLGVTTINRAYARSYFGTTKRDSRVTIYATDLVVPIIVVENLGNVAITTNPNYDPNTTAINHQLLNDKHHTSFSPRAGIKDVHVDLFWNWSLSSSWIVTSKINLTQLVGNNRMSPIVERKTNLTVSSAIAYRF